MTKKIRIGIVGVGSIANTHIQAYLKVENIELVAFCDINEERLKFMQKEYGVTKGYTSLMTMLENEELDAVNVCTWNNAHASCSIMALNHGVNVLCEKPMAMNTKEALEMKAAAERNKKLLMVGLVKRFGTDLKIIEDLKEKDFFGEIYHMKSKYIRRYGSPGGWFSDKARSGGGPLIDLGVHILDMMNYLYDCDQPESVYGYTFDTIGNLPNLIRSADYIASDSTVSTFDVEDFAGAVIRFPNNRVAVLETSYNLFTDRDNEGLEVYGNKGGAKLGEKLTLSCNTHNYMTNSNILIDSKFDFEDAFYKEMQHFLACVEGKETCRATADDGIRNMQVLDAIYLSAQTHNEVKLS